MMDTGLADRLRYWLEPAGFPVVEVDGWQTRGRTYAAYAPKGALCHHTAGPAAGDKPSLGICINGRSDLPGPLCQVFGSRSLAAYVVAAGVANHAGPGGWHSLKGNQTVGGLELENTGHGDEPATERQKDFAARVLCALITAPGSPADPALCCQHFEWSTEGKIDFHDWLGSDLRARVATLLAHGPGASPVPQPSPPALYQEDEMVIYQRQNGPDATVQDSYLLHAGKLVYQSAHEVWLLASKGVPVVDHTSDKGWSALTKAYGQPVGPTV